jgi:hypothetical protein
VDLAHNINMHATFVMSGPGIEQSSPVTGLRAIDVAPTLAYLLGIPGPRTPGRDPDKLTTKPSFKVDHDPRHQ